MNVHLTWVKAHVGIHGNEMADQNAKNAASMTNVAICEPYLPLPSSATKTATSKQMLHAWQQAWNSRLDCRQTKIFIDNINKSVAKHLLKARRFQASRAIQFFTGHCNMQKHQVLRKYETDDKCRACKQVGSIESPEHILLECRYFNRLRSKIFGSGWYTLPTTDLPVWQLLDFIDSPEVADLMIAQVTE